MPTPQADLSSAAQLRQVMNYAAQLELEVDRLRRRDQFLQQEAGDHIRQAVSMCKDPGGAQGAASALAELDIAINSFRELLRDLHEPPGYHPAFDQVVAIAVRPLAEHVFRAQQRLSGATHAVLRLDLQPDHVDWFPARLRHILENLISNALRFRAPDKGEVRVGLQLRLQNGGYELRFTDNGLGMRGDQSAGMLELFYRAAPARGAGLGVGLAVVKLLVEQCCGTISISSDEGKGTSVTIVLPCFNLDDHVD